MWLGTESSKCPTCSELAAPAGSAVRCKVQRDLEDGTWTESRAWMSEEDALSEAAANHRFNKQKAIRIRYSRKFNGRWKNCGTKPYPPNEKAEL